MLVAALLLLSTPLTAAPPPETAAIDRANEALAEGSPNKAAQVLRDVLPRVSSPEAEARVRCLLGVAALASDDPRGAEKALAPVPVDQVCGTRAGFLRADALSRQGRTSEATALYDQLGTSFLGDDRDGRTVDATMPIVRKLLASDSGREAGQNLLETLLDLRISPTRAAALARELATDQRDHPADSAANYVEDRPTACSALSTALAATESRDDRLLAAEVCDRDASLLLLSALPDDDADRAWLLTRGASEPATAALGLRSLALRPDPTRRSRVATLLAQSHDLGALPLLEADPAPSALKERADLLLAAARTVDAEVALRAHLDSFPTDPHRSEVATEHAQVLLQLGDTAVAAGRWDEALVRYEALLTTHPEDPLAPDAAYRSGLALRALGRKDDARHRWEEVVARFPGSAEPAIAALARLRAFDEHDPDGALTELKKRPDGSLEADRLTEPGLWIETRGRAVSRPTVRIGARNLEQVEVRLHRIDLEAYVRAGGTPEDLSNLDVAAIAPDRTLPVKVPGYEPHRDLAFDVPIPVGPGLYAVTVASAEEEAHTLLLVSDLSVVARAVGGDIAVATFDAEGRPQGGARVIVGEIEGRTDGTGLWTSSGSAPYGIVLAERNGSWAITTLPGGTSGRVDEGEVVLAELDRPVYLPADHVAIRAAARDADQKPMVGKWTVWLSGHGNTEPVEVDTDKQGVFVADLTLPDLEPDDYHDSRPMPSSWVVQGIAPGSATPRALARFQVAPRDPNGETVDLRLDGADAVATVRGPDGEPVQGVAVTFDQGGSGRTDARGEVRVHGPPATVPWSVSAQVPDGPSATARRPSPGGWRLELAAAQDRLRPGEAPKVTIRLKDTDDQPVTGPVSLVLYRKQPPVKTDLPPRDPWVEEPETGFRGPISWSGPAPEEPARALDPIWRSDAPLADGAAVPLPGLEPGDYHLVAALPDADAALDLTVSAQALRLVGALDPGLGDRLELEPDGAGALLTAESDRLLWAAVRPDGKAAPAVVDVRWNGAVTLAATAPDGQVHVRSVHADPTLHVAIETAPEEGGVRVRATVRSATGRPVAASVALTAWDSGLEREVGEAQALGSWHGEGAAAEEGAIGADLRDGSAGEPIAPALLEEVKREEERAKAQRASDGILSDNALADAMLGDDIGIAGFGTSGGGAGGSGYGEGMGGLGSRGASGYGSGGGHFGMSLPGVRQRVLWSVGATDGNGVATAFLAGPPARYSVRASALGADGVGTARIRVDTRARAWLVAHSPAPGAPGDQGTPWITVVNGTDHELAGPLVAGSASVDVSLPAGAATTVAVGEALPPGPDVLQVRWKPGAEAALATWSFPLQPGSPDPAGPLLVRADGLAPIALRPDPAIAFDPARVAVAGRAALAAEPVDPNPALREVARSTRLQLQGIRWPDARSGAVALLFLAEAGHAGADLSFGELEALATAIPTPVDPLERAWVLRARTAAGLEVDPNLTALVAGDAATDPRVAALLALATGKPSGTLDPATPLGAAATRRLGHPVNAAALIASGPPDPGDPALPDWIAAVRDAPGAAGGKSLRVELSSAAPGPWSWHAAPREPASPAPPVQHVERGDGGRPLFATLDPRDEAPCDPCALGVGEVLIVDGLDLGLGLPSGLALEWVGDNRPMLRAVAPGRYVLRGVGHGPGGLTVEVQPAPARRTAAAALALARVAVDLGEAPALPPAPLRPEQARTEAGLAFEAAVKVDRDAEIAGAFRTLAATDPSASVPLPSVARAARALAATGDPVASIRAWRAGLDAAFAAEAAGIGRFAPVSGDLLVIQKVREAALRYPDGPLVGDALYLLPARLLGLADAGPSQQETERGITATDIRLTAAAWDREFLAAYPSHSLATAAGVRLSRVLLTLGVPDRAADWAHRVAEQNPDAPLLDGLLYLEALARTEAGDASGATPLLHRLVDRPFPTDEGALGPSEHRQDAELVLGRLYESQGQVERALAAYHEAMPLPEASRATEALKTTSLSAPAVVRLRSGENAKIPVEVTNLDELRIRAYKVDLRTLYLRDLGLSGATGIAVAGVSPAWAGTRTERTGPFPEQHEVALPLNGPGAWLVQIEGAGVTRSTLVVRSALELFAVDVGDARRITLRRGGKAAAGVEVRALAGGQIARVVTDVRGVAEVPSEAAVLAWSGDDWAFTDPARGDGSNASAPDKTDETGLEPLLQGLDERIRARQQQDDDQYKQRFDEKSESLRLDAL